MATCTIASVNQPLGQALFLGIFAGDTFYVGVTRSEPIVVTSGSTSP